MFPLYSFIIIPFLFSAITLILFYTKKKNKLEVLKRKTFICAVQFY